MTDEQVLDFKNEVRQYLNDRNLIVEEGPEFNYYVDSQGNKQGIGYVPVAKIQNPFDTVQDLKKIVLNNLNIHKLSAYEISNSITASPDNKYIYYADTFKKKIYKTNLAQDISYIIVFSFFKMLDLKGFPDGSTIDINGYLWNAEWNGGQVVNYDLNGRLINTIKTPMKRPTCCVFGGKNMNILYITSALEAGDSRRQCIR